MFPAARGKKRKKKKKSVGREGSFGCVEKILHGLVLTVSPPYCYGKFIVQKWFPFHMKFVSVLFLYIQNELKKCLNWKLIGIFIHFKIPDYSWQKILDEWSCLQCVTIAIPWQKTSACKINFHTASQTIKRFILQLRIQTEIRPILLSRQE